MQEKIRQLLLTAFLNSCNVETKNKKQKNKKIVGIEQKVAALSTTIVSLGKIIQVLIPIILTIYLSNTGKYDIISFPYFLLLLIFIVSIIDLWYDYLQKNFLFDIMSFRQKENLFLENENVQKAIESNIYKNATLVTLLREFQTTILNFENEESNEFSRICEELIFSIYDYLNHIKETGEIYTVALYLFDEKETLKDLISKKPHIIGKGKRIDKGRDWSIFSESHLSHTYRSKQPQVFFDIQDFLPGVSDNTKDYDFDTYKASIAVPLKYKNTKEDNVRAVFCITSSIPGAFTGTKYPENDSYKRLFNERQAYITMCGFLLEHLLGKISPASNKEIFQLQDDYEKKLQLKD